MLCLGLKLGKMITMTLPSGEQIVIRLYEMGVGQVKLGFSAPKEVRILRNELIEETPREDETPIVNPDWVRGAQDERRMKR